MVSYDCKMSSDLCYIISSACLQRKIHLKRQGNWQTNRFDWISINRRDTTENKRQSKFFKPKKIQGFFI